MEPRNNQKIFFVSNVSKTFEIKFCCYPDILDDNVLVHFVACGLEPGTNFRWNIFPLKIMVFSPLNTLSMLIQTMYILGILEDVTSSSNSFQVSLCGCQLSRKIFFQSTSYHYLP